MYRNEHTGATLEIIEDGKGFRTIVRYPESKHTDAEVKSKTHKTYASVEKMISRGGFKRAII